MKDALKEFIDSNREALDDKSPSTKVWPAIRASLQEQGRKNLWHSAPLWRAAAILLFGLSSYLFLSADHSSIKKREVSQLQGEFSDLESFYKGQIAEKVAFIQDFDYGYEDDEYTQDVQKLDAMYQVLREEMKNKPSAKVKDALILNMLIRIDMLNQQIKRLEDTRKEEEEPSSSI